MRRPVSLAAAVLLASCVTAAAVAEPAALPADVLSFRAFFRLPVGTRGLEISPVLAAADGRRVRLRGYVVVQERPQAGRFLLAPQPIHMSEHADGEADDLPPQTVTVWLHPSQRDRVVEAPEGPVTLEGRLSVGREEADDGRVSWVRLHLDEQATRLATITGGAR